MNKATKIGLNLTQKLKLDRAVLSLLNKKAINKFMLGHCWQHKGYKQLFNRYLIWKEIIGKNNIGFADKKVLEIGSGASVGLGYFFLKENYQSWTASDFFQDLSADERAMKREIILIKKIAAEYESNILNYIQFSDNRIAFSQKISFCKLNIVKFTEEWSAKFDIILSTDVLEHIEVEQMDTAIKNLSSYLSPGGLMLHDIDLRDHVNVLNPQGFLKYPPEIWDKLTRGTIFYTNRLRLRDYLEIFLRHGLKVRWLEKIKQPLTNRVKIDKYFNQYSDEELETIRAQIILEKV